VDLATLKEKTDKEQEVIATWFFFLWVPCLILKGLVLSCLMYWFIQPGVEAPLSQCIGIVLVANLLIPQYSPVNHQKIYRMILGPTFVLAAGYVVHLVG